MFSREIPERFVETLLNSGTLVVFPLIEKTVRCAQVPVH